MKVEPVQRNAPDFARVIGVDPPYLEYGVQSQPGVHKEQHQHRVGKASGFRRHRARLE